MRNDVLARKKELEDLLEVQKTCEPGEEKTFVQD